MKELKKNKLDLEYNFESRKAIIFLTAMTITFIGFLGVMISQGLIETALSIGVVILIIGTALYQRTKMRMDDILEEIENL